MRCPALAPLAARGADLPERCLRVAAALGQLTIACVMDPANGHKLLRKGICQRFCPTERGDQLEAAITDLQLSLELMEAAPVGRRTVDDVFTAKKQLGITYNELGMSAPPAPSSRCCPHSLGLTTRCMCLSAQERTMPATTSRRTTPSPKPWRWSAHGRTSSTEATRCANRASW